MGSKKVSNWANMKASLPKDMLEAVEKGPDYVKGKTFKVSESDRKQEGWIDVDEVEWADEDMCAACVSFPGFKDYTTDNRPSDFDWRDLGAVTSVKNQKYCGSCWTFSTAADIEGTHYLATGDLVSFSEQQIVACDSYMYGAMQYIAKAGGIISDALYPYKGIMMDYSGDTPTCDKPLVSTTLEDDNSTAMAHIESWQFVAMGEEYEDLMATVMLKNGPLSIAINAIGMDYYVHGITGCETIAGADYCEAGAIADTYPCDPESLDHGVLIVAYGEQDDTKYWVIKEQLGRRVGRGWLLPPRAWQRPLWCCQHGSAHGVQKELGGARSLLGY